MPPPPPAKEGARVQVGAKACTLAGVRPARPLGQQAQSPALAVAAARRWRHPLSLGCPTVPISRCACSPSYNMADFQGGTPASTRSLRDLASGDRRLELWAALRAVGQRPRQRPSKSIPCRNEARPRVTRRSTDGLPAQLRPQGGANMWSVQVDNWPPRSARQPGGANRVTPPSGPESGGDHM